MKANDAKKGYKNIMLRILLDDYVGNGTSSSGIQRIGNKIVQTVNTVGNTVNSWLAFEVLSVPTNKKMTHGMT
jgi:hypothetical protein